MYAVETKALTKYYGKSRGIIDLDLKIEEGDVFGFIGPNGAGKSTTIRLLLGMIRPTSGQAMVFGKDIVKKKKEILADIGYMPSEARFYNRMKVGDIIKLAADLHHKDCSKEAKRLCDRLQLDVTKVVEDLSLGNRKKLSIVCALQHKPRLAILDEPTSGLDPLIQKEFFDVLSERNKEGSTIFFSSHVLPDIQNHCNNAAIIRNGKIIKVGEVEEFAKTSAKVITLKKLSDDKILHNENLYENIANLEKVPDGLRFLYKGDIRQFIQEIQRAEFEDITITEPSLDEIFMHFYHQEAD